MALLWVVVVPGNHLECVPTLSFGWTEYYKVSG